MVSSMCQEIGGISMKDKEFFVLDDDWQEKLFKEALEELGDEEALKIIDEEQKKVQLKIDKELEQMKVNGLLK